MFTVTWRQTAKRKKGYSTADTEYYYQNGVYPDGTYPGQNGQLFSGTGETLDAATKDLETKLTANLSKNVDKAINDRHAAFKKALAQ